MALLAASAPDAATLQSALGDAMPATYVDALQLFQIGDAAAASGDQAAAQRAYHMLVFDSSQEVRLEARFRLALVEAARGNLARAASLFRQVLDYRPDASRVRLEFARLLSRTGDHEGARRQVRLIKISGLSPSVASLIERYSEALGMQRKSVDTFEIALAHDANIDETMRSEPLVADLNEEARAKSGRGASLRNQLYRRFAITHGDMRRVTHAIRSVV